MKKPTIAFYDIPTLERIATSFVEEFHDSEDAAVDIEFIIEGKLGWTIKCHGTLIDTHSVEAFITNKKVIYIDSFLANSWERKYRFTLAEEVAHYILHRSLYTGCKNLEEHLAIYESLSDSTYKRMDRNAKYLAAAILMPSVTYEKLAFDIYGRLDKKIYSTNEAVLYKIALDLSNSFNVSDWSSRIRFKNLGLHRKLITL